LIHGLRTQSGPGHDLVMSNSGHFPSGHHRWHTAKCSRPVSVEQSLPSLFCPWIRFSHFASGLVGNTAFDRQVDIYRSWPEAGRFRCYIANSQPALSPQHQRYGWRDEDTPLWRPSPRPSRLCPEPAPSRQDKPSLVSFSSEGQCSPQP